MRNIANFIGDSSKYLSFADDKIIYNSCDSYEGAIQESENSIRTLNDWLNTRGLKLSKTKTKMMMFTKRDMPPKNNRRPIMLQGEMIEEVENIRFLGVQLNNKMRWGQHINYTREKAKKYVSILKAISSLKVGAHPNTLLTVYKGLIRSTLDWGAMFYHDPKMNY